MRHVIHFKDDAQRLGNPFNIKQENTVLQEILQPRSHIG